jgi:hypothetical protein
MRANDEKAEGLVGEALRTRRKAASSCASSRTAFCPQSSPAAACARASTHSLRGSISRSRCLSPPAGSRRSRGERVLHRGRGAHQRRQARPRRGRGHGRRWRARCSVWRCATTASAAPMPRAMDCSGCATARPRSGAASTLRARGGTVVTLCPRSGPVIARAPHTAGEGRPLRREPHPRGSPRSTRTPLGDACDRRLDHVVVFLPHDATPGCRLIDLLVVRAGGVADDVGDSGGIGDHDRVRRARYLQGPA